MWPVQDLAQIFHQIGISKAATRQKNNLAVAGQQFCSLFQQVAIAFKRNSIAAMLDHFPDQGNRSSSVNNGETDMTEPIPEHGSIQRQVDEIIFPFCHGFLNDLIRLLFSQRLN